MTKRLKPPKLKAIKSEIIDHINCQAFVPMKPELTTILNRMSVKSLRVLRIAFIAAYDSGREHEQTSWDYTNYGEP